MKLTSERIGFYGCCVLTAAPLLFAHYPPMVDLPQHAAQVATLINLSNPAFAYKDLFTVEWIRPYLGGYLVIWCLSQFMSVLTACKIVIAAAVVATPLAAAGLRSQFSTDRRLDWLLITVVYGFAFQWGLLNFLVGAPFVFLFLTLAFRYAARPTVRSGVLLALFAHALLAVHLLIAACACGLAFVYVVSGRSSWKARLAASLPFVSPIPVVIAWLAWVLSFSVQAREAGPWGLSLYRPLFLLAPSFGLPATPGGMAAGAAIFALPFLFGARPTRDRQRLAVFGAYLLWMMLGPNYFMGNYFTYQRFSFLALPLFLVALDDPPAERKRSSAPGLVQGLVVALPVALIVLTCVLFDAFGRESRGYSEIAAEMKPGKRVLGLMFNNSSVLFDPPVYVHFASWYQAEHQGVADFSFAQFGLVVCYKPTAAVFVPRGFEWVPQAFDWRRNAGWLYDYFIVRSDKDVSAFVFRTAPGRVRLVAQHRPWWLYERVPDAAAPPAQPAR